MEKRTIKFGDVDWSRKDTERIDIIIRSRQVTEYYYVNKFEQQLGKLLGFEHVIATSSGATAAQVLWMAVAAKGGYGWNAGTVITPALAFGSTTNSIRCAGRKIYMVDIEQDLNMAVPLGGPATLMHQPLGIQFVANMGRTVRMDTVREYAREWGLFFAVDACEAHGAQLYGSGINAYADAAVYSFYPAHIMTCGSEGGAIATNDAGLACLCRSIKSHGRPAYAIDHKFVTVGTNAKWNEFAAARALTDIENFREIFTKRRHIRKALLYRLAEFPIRLFHDADHETIAPHAFPILTDSLSNLKDHLDEWQIEWKPLWGPLSNHEANGDYGVSRDYFKNALEVGLRGLHIGCHQGISDSDIEYIYEVFKLFYR